MKRKSLLLAACLVAVVCSTVRAQSIGGEIVLLNPPDSLLYGSSYTFDFAFSNNTELEVLASTNGFEIYTDNNAGYALAVDEDKWSTIMAPLMGGAWVYRSWGSGVPDTVGFAALLEGRSPGVPAGAFLQSISFTVTLNDVSSGATELCIDSCFFPPGGEWLWAMSAGYWSARIPVAEWAGTCWDLRQRNCGDMDGDMSINIYDMTYIARYFFKGGAAPVVHGAADVNCDGNVNVTDLGYMVAYMFNNGPDPCAECP